MGRDLEFMCIVPARAGSKRFPRKNLHTIGGHRLVNLACQQGLELFKSVIVTTDDPEVAESVSGIKGVRLLERPKDLAQDDTPMSQVILHTYLRMSQPGDTEPLIVLLQPTSPLRSLIDIMAVTRKACWRSPVFSCLEGTDVPNGAVYAATMSDWMEWPFTMSDWVHVPMPASRSIDINTREQYEEACRRWEMTHRD